MFAKRSSASVLPEAVELREIAPQPVASVRIHKAAAALPAAFDEYLPIIGKRLLEAGGQIIGAPFARYHGMAKGEFDVEIGFPARGVERLSSLGGLAPGEVGRSELPGGRMAAYLHVGPYAGIGKAWEALEALVADHGLVPIAPGWDSYVDNPDEIPVEQLRTELFQPVR